MFWTQIHNDLSAYVTLGGHHVNSSRKPNCPKFLTVAPFLPSRVGVQLPPLTILCIAALEACIYRELREVSRV